MIANGTAAADHVQIAPASGEATVSGLAAAVAVANAEPTDQLIVNGLAGDDEIAAQPAVAHLLDVLIDGGDGADTAVAQGSNGERHDPGRSCGSGGCLLATASVRSRRRPRTST